MESFEQPGDRRKLGRWCKSAKMTPLQALARLWRILDEHGEFIDDLSYPACMRVQRMEEFADDCRKAYWQDQDARAQAVAIEQIAKLGKEQRKTRKGWRTKAR